MKAEEGTLKSIYLGRVIHRTEELAHSTAVHQLYAYLPMNGIALTDGSWLGEDYSFCNRARAAGFSVYLDTSIVNLVHVAPAAWRLPAESTWFREGMTALRR